MIITYSQRDLFVKYLVADYLEKMYAGPLHYTDVDY